MKTVLVFLTLISISCAAPIFSEDEPLPIPEPIPAPEIVSGSGWTTEKIIACNVNGNCGIAQVRDFVCE